MTDPKPYTPEEWAKLDKYLWECLEDEDRARLLATVRALADTREALRLMMQGLADCGEWAPHHYFEEGWERGQKLIGPITPSTPSEG